MARCQRTFRRLPGNGPVWTCPQCPDRESYETIQDPDLLHYAALAYRACVAEFGPPPDEGAPLQWLLGLRPECIREPHEGRQAGYGIYLQRGSDPCQLRLQAAHEIFHRVCSRGAVFHWTHEMLACHFAIRQLRAAGWNAYADQQERAYAEEARLLSTETMRACDLWREEYPPGLYGRAYVVGGALIGAVGWPEVRRIAHLPAMPGGGPDLGRWIDVWPGGVRRDIERVLTEPSGDRRGI